MAGAERVIAASPATRLYTPRRVPKGTMRAMTIDEVRTALAAVEVREQVILQLATFGDSARRDIRPPTDPCIGGLEGSQGRAARLPRSMIPKTDRQNGMLLLLRRQPT